MNRPVVLVAEDDASVRMTIEFVLQDEGFDVLSTGNGEEALRVARRVLPDAILLDQLMPKMDGKEVLRALRQNERTAGIPVFVLSGMARGRDDWPDAHFVGKPFSPDDLVAMLKTTISAAQRGEV